MVWRRSVQAILIATLFVLANAADAAPWAPSVLHAPSGLTATPISTSQVTLRWTDGNSNESGFAVERSLTSSSGFTVVGTTRKNVNAYQDTGLGAGTTYYYRVRAAGKGGSISPGQTPLARLGAVMSRVRSGHITCRLHEGARPIDSTTPRCY